MKASDRFILGAVIIALLVNLASTFLTAEYPQIGTFTAILLGAALLVWAIYRMLSVSLQYVRFGRYAVLVFFISRKGELLLIKHPFHGVLLPPGGRLHQWELPHQAVARALKAEAGITDFEFHPRFHNASLMLSEIVEEVPRPYSVHMEFRRQRGFVKFHYAFVYVCQFPSADQPLPIVDEYQPRWMSAEEIYQLGKDLRPFVDIIWRYEDIMHTLFPGMMTVTFRQTHDS